ncbi:hypothetical protein ACR6C2_24445 [Streptomyces sp. INA 01156]
MFAQGTSRTDLKQAIDRQVTAGPALSFGTTQWPHTDDKPVTREITYRDDGDRPDSLTLATEASGENGKRAAEGMFEVPPKRLTVPAGSGSSEPSRTRSPRSASTTTALRSHKVAPCRGMTGTARRRGTTRAGQRSAIHVQSR